jgi:glycine/D-amino acid oxidase-like deaminating enzyme
LGEQARAPLEAIAQLVTAEERIEPVVLSARYAAFPFDPQAWLADVLARIANTPQADLRRGRVTGVVRHTHATTVRGVEVDGDVIEADAIVVAMGPWSFMVAARVTMAR